MLLLPCDRLVERSSPLQRWLALYPVESRKGEMHNPGFFLLECCCVVLSHFSALQSKFRHCVLLYSDLISAMHQEFNHTCTYTADHHRISRISSTLAALPLPRNNSRSSLPERHLHSLSRSTTHHHNVDNSPTDRPRGLSYLANFYPPQWCTKTNLRRPRERQNARRPGQCRRPPQGREKGS
jgi:hypothetical protein